MCHHTKPVRQWRKLKRWAGNCYNIRRKSRLAPSDSPLFGPLKELLEDRIKLFKNDEYVQQHVQNFLQDAIKDFYAAGFSQLV